MTENKWKKMISLVDTMGDWGGYQLYEWFKLFPEQRETALREYIYRATVQALPGRCLAQAVLAGVGLAAETLYLLLSGSDGRGAAAAVYVLLQACVLVLALLTRRAVLASDWQMEKHGGLTTE